MQRKMAFDCVVRSVAILDVPTVRLRLRQTERLVRCHFSTFGSDDPLLVSAWEGVGSEGIPCFVDAPAFRKKLGRR